MVLGGRIAGAQAPQPLVLGVVAALIGGFQGFLIAYVGIPSFIVTLGMMLSLSGLVRYITGGAASGAGPRQRSRALPRAMRMAS